MRPFVFAVLFLFVLLTAASSFGQGVRVGPNGEVSKQTLSLPDAFYNENFGFAAGYVYGVVGQPGFLRQPVKGIRFAGEGVAGFLLV